MNKKSGLRYFSFREKHENLSSDLSDSDFAGHEKNVFLQPFQENREGDSPLAQLVRVPYIRD